MNVIHPVDDSTPLILQSADSVRKSSIAYWNTSKLFNSSVHSDFLSSFYIDLNTNFILFLNKLCRYLHWGKPDLSNERERSNFITLLLISLHSRNCVAVTFGNQWAHVVRHKRGNKRKFVPLFVRFNLESWKNFILIHFKPFKWLVYC